MVKELKKFKYLNYTITSDAKTAHHIEKRKQAANLAKVELDKLNLKNSYLQPEVIGLMV